MNNDNWYQEQFFNDEFDYPRCENCGNPKIEAGYEMKLCKECREKLYRKPYPILIKLLGVAIVAVVIIALIHFPSSLNAGIAYERGLQAESEGKYVTAMKEYKKVVKRFPDSTIALASLFVTSYQNGEIDDLNALYDKLEGEEITDDSLVDKVNRTVDCWNKYYYISDELDNILQKAKNMDNDKAISLFQEYMNKNPEDISSATYYYGILLYDIGELQKAKKVIEGALKSNPDNYEGQLLQAEIYSEMGEYQKATDCCNYVLKHNVEYSYAYDTLARVELMNHEDKKGLKTARKAFQLNQKDSGIVATLAIAYHYNHNTRERDAMLKKFKKFKDDNTYDLDLMEGIFSGDYQWR
ncbi:tetratricopeptide repeat protein [Anaeromicropila herbilytica]|uniref:Tetratricopeptide repeat protein n=1 Tax=Anaeromicropila herbilytica TaxID=2785025 RepID=A0A7R7IE75_9FIRM|nr:tetratricopeptide repeat protein [Anaeromicropila herbilytica]BCN31819.1 hypothetical protein bsdtb5_31140 [Anaeromicropila herbilytica]